MMHRLVLNETLCKVMFLSSSLGMHDIESIAKTERLVLICQNRLKCRNVNQYMTETPVELIYKWISYSLNACGFSNHLFMALRSRRLIEETQNLPPNHDTANTLNSWLFSKTNKMYQVKVGKKLKLLQTNYTVYLITEEARCS